MQKYRGKKVVIYGCGENYQRDKKFLEKFFYVAACSDQRKNNDDKYISPLELRLYKNDFQFVYVTSIKYYEEIKSYLINACGICSENIICEYDLYPELIYENRTQIGAHFKLGGNYIDIKEYKEDIYSPLYNYDGIIYDTTPEIYNKKGQPMEIFFIRDYHSAHEPYGFGSRVFYDRYNWKLKTHFYTHLSMKELMGNPIRRYGCFMESRGIVPNDYEWAINNKEYINDNFDLFFTHDEELLNLIPNARFAIFSSCPNYAKFENNREWLDIQYKNKTKNISFLSSNKEMCELHKLRKPVAKQCKESGMVDVFGRIDGGVFVENIEDVFKPYRYSIIMENYISKYYWSERLSDCFMAQTIPILLGVTGIGEFFNTDGIISIDIEDCYDIRKVLKNCNEEDYDNRLDAVLDNYKRIQKFRKSPWDYMYEKYIEK